MAWDRYGSISGAVLSDRTVRDRWMTEGTAAGFGVLANAWKETVRDAVADIRASREAAKARGRARAKLRSIANSAAERGDHTKATRIGRHNLATVKRDRQDTRWKQKVRTETYRAVNAVTDKAAVIVTEDLTKTFTGRKNLGRNMNRRLAAWTKGLTAQALKDVSERRGSALAMVNAAYTSQVDPRTGLLTARRGDRLHLPGGDVMQADHAAAINILARASDPDIALHTPHTRVKQILLERADRQRIRLPIQDSRHHQVPESEPSDLARTQV